MHDLGAPAGRTDAPHASARPTPPESRRARLVRWFDSWMRSLGMAFVLFLIVRTFLLEAFQIPSGSMERTLLSGDFLFVNKAVYGAQIPGTEARLPAFGEPARGDVIVFSYPRDPALNYVKRVVGMPGDTVAMRRGRVWVNGNPLDEPYAQRTDPAHDVTDPQFAWQRGYLADRAVEVRRRYRPTRDSWGPLIVPPDRYFVLGDNRDNSADSRYWGFVERRAVKGRPLLVYFSFDRDTGHPWSWLTEIRWSRLGLLVR